MKILLARLALTLGVCALAPTAARGDDRTWVSVGRIRMLTANDDEYIRFEADSLSRCDGTVSLYTADLPGLDGKLRAFNYFYPLLLSAMANRYEVRVVLDEDCENTKLGKANTVTDLMVIAN